MSGAEEGSRRGEPMLDTKTHMSTICTDSHIFGTIEDLEEN